MFTYSIKRGHEIREFHVVVVHRRQRNVQSRAMQVEICCCWQNPITFLPFFLPSPSSLVLLSSRNSATMLTSHFYFNICIEKADAKGWLAKMTIVMTSLPWARGFQCLFTFALVSASCWLAEIWYLNKSNLCLKLKITYSCTVAPFDANVTKEKAHM